MINEVDFSFIPTHCPLCNVKLVQVGRDLACENETCDSKIFGYLGRIMAIQSVDGIGGTLVDQFYDSFQIKNMADLTNVIRYTNLHQLTQFFGGSTAQKFMAVIENLRNFSPTVGQYAWMTNIPRLGTSSSEEFDKNVTAEEMRVVVASGIAPQKWGDMVGNYLENTGMDLLKKYFHRFGELMELFGGRITQKEFKKKASGQTVFFSLTGALSKTRDEIVEEFKQYGCEFKPNKATIFICDKVSSSAKYQDAVKRGLEIVTEAQFRARFIQ